MSKVIDFNKKINEIINNTNLDGALKMVREKKNNSLILTLKNNCFVGEEICLIAEEACRYENIEFLKWILLNHDEVLYYYPCEILDIAINSFNCDLLKLVLEAYDKEYSPIIKYKETYERVAVNNKIDVIDLLRKYKVI